jgi:hypothetical protein
VASRLETLAKNPTFSRVDDTIDYIQEILYKGSKDMTVPINKKVEGILKKVTADLNEGLKRTGGQEYRDINSQYAKIIGVRNDLNKLLGPKGNRGGSLMKRVFSPSDAGTKKLFALVKEITGVDLVDEATLAKFAMENAGDARQSSLLEEVIRGRVPSKASFIEAAARKTIGKLQDPIGKARRIIQGKK